MDKKDIALIAPLVLIIIFFWPILEFLGLSEPAKEKVDTPQDSAFVQPVDTTFGRPFVDNTNNGQANSTPPAFAVSDSTFENAVNPYTTLTDSIPVETTLVVTSEYTIILTNRGGGPVSIKLSEYTYKDGRPIEMLNDASAPTPDIRLAGGSYSTGQLYYQADKQAGRYDVSSEPFEISFRTESETIGSITKSYRFYPNEYHYDLAITIGNPELLGLERSYQLKWNTPLGVTEPLPETDYEAMQAVAMMVGSRETLDDFDNGRLRQELTGYTSWAGVRSKYFAGVIIPRNREASAAVADGLKRDIQTPDGELEEKRITAGVKMEFPGNAAFTDSFTVFAGPLDYSLMAKYDIGLEDMLDIGTTPVIGIIIKPFALGIIWLLPRMYDIFPNYGLVIILFALAIKIVTLPLSLKSFKSMAAMKALQPKIEKLKAKHKKNPKALNEETMKLYKAHGVNPISGCLPMLPQMPLFFALFSVFRSTILLRQAPFVGFIDDLSRGASGFTDPYILLVIVMVGAQFLSQSLTMASNQQNKMLMYMMPVFMGWIFHSFAAGLVLYWACFSLFSMIDYFVFKRRNNSQVKTA